MTEIVTQMSARVFIGAPLCRNRQWLRISASYAEQMVLAMRSLSRFPRIIRPLMQHLAPEMRRLNEVHNAARSLLSPILASRAKERSMSEAQEKSVDALQWFSEVASTKKQHFDPLYTQLGLTVVAVSTTSALLTNVMFDLVAHPDLIQELRQEMMDVLRPQAEGDRWTKASLQRLQLLDSAMKETQRLNPPEALLMRRRVVRDFTLSDGTVLPAGSTIALPSVALRDPAFFDRPEEYQGSRFLKMRQEAGSQNKWQFVSTSKEMFGFGHGTHACPGRFFASDEAKVALVHLLMKYDWAFAGPVQGPEGRPKSLTAFEMIVPNPAVHLMYRARKPEIEL